ncbi:desulfoferrodoxin [Candidatus Berkelbacteria bacterium CG10_big_fil_rev_8_21_14_0_10_41_12]|uniref:Desulfoferrodoxin n=1 Tax=Candidatus Berkelbacteria bacterium CG10_big_fil_rev_8_21_14_0_10_41_12 TaxID=1974513 RepID=A0A2M6WWZ4_9BACT|nr:MAG: desulfoferrodoxin [Candidatus Berkelbacteria bacterium CG10_big_fil_rev_8_21_14_0_10_41_12]
MRKLNEIYKCNICGNIIEVVHASYGELVCCGKPMELQKEKTDEANLTAKHRPVIEKTKDGLLIKVGSVPHPMEKEHHIEWIEVLSGDKTYRQTLKPGGKPEAIFCLKEARSARIYCNIHGLWKN